MAISRRGMRRIVVDGVEHFWRATRDWYDYSDVLILCAQPQRRIRFSSTGCDPQDYGWWYRIPAVVLPRHIERAIKVSRHLGHDARLTNRELLEVFGIDPGRPQDRLRDLERALSARNADDTVQALLAIGCHGDAGELVDDWIASHSETLGATSLQAIVDGAQMLTARKVRSAIAFLDEACRRVGVELGVDCHRLDALVAQSPILPPRPTGIPAHHVWWTRA